MGIGSSGMQGEYRRHRRHPSSKYGSYAGKKHQHGSPYRKTGLRSPAQPVQHVVPISQYPHHSYGYNPNPYIQPPVHSGYNPMYYNNYSNSPYAYYRQQPAMAPQQVPIYPTAPMPPQQVPIYPTAPMPPQQVPIYPTAPLPPQQAPIYPTAPYSMYPPYSSPAAYPTGSPYSNPYNQPQAQPVYNNIYSSPTYSSGGGLVNPSFASSGPYNLTVGQISTDWTGGGKISPGFLGPPI